MFVEHVMALLIVISKSKMLLDKKRAMLQRELGFRKFNILQQIHSEEKAVQKSLLMLIDKWLFLEILMRYRHQVYLVTTNSIQKLSKLIA